jgi:hypothetical protein
MNEFNRAAKLGDRVRVRPESRHCPGEYGIVTGRTVEFRGGSGKRVVLCNVILDQDKGGTDFEDKDLLKEFKIGDHVIVSAKSNSDHQAVDAVIVSMIHCNEDTSLWHVAKQSNLNAQASIFYEDLMFTPPDEQAEALGWIHNRGLLGNTSSGPKMQNLPKGNPHAVKFEDLVSKEIMPNRPPVKVGPETKILLCEGCPSRSPVPCEKCYRELDMEYFEKKLFASLGLKTEFLGVDPDRLEKHRALAGVFEKRYPEAQKRSAAEKLAQFANSYGMSKETFQEYMNMPIPADEARVAAKKNRLKEMKNILDRGLCIPKEHMAEYKALVDEVGDEYRLDMEKKQAESRIHRVFEVTKSVMRMYMDPSLYGSLCTDPALSTVPLKETWSATIVLASGREVRIPDPNPEKWELVETKKDLPIVPVQIVLEALFSSAGVNGPDRLHQKSYTHAVVHEQGRCWIKDMKRIVEQGEHKGPFEHRFSYLVELRHFKERAVEENSYPNSLPTLSVLW